jgi:predicted TIM-barrel fold metal-dependent hydrolase
MRPRPVPAALASRAVPAVLTEAAAALERVWRGHVRPLVPIAEGLVDVHAHLGEDASDGSRLDLPALVATMDAGGVASSWAFPFQSPPGAGYAAANSAVLAAAEASGGRVVAFARSEPGAHFRAELEAALDAGARGIKLHTSLPGFDFSHPELDVAFALAAERRVPLLFHTGRAVPAFARDLARLLERHPAAQVVLAHCAIADLHDVCALRHPNVHFDTSLWNSLDVRALLAEAAPEQLLYGSDAPYYTPIGTQAKLFLQLAAIGAGDDRRSDVAVRSAARLLAGEPCAALSEPLAARAQLPARPRLRAHEYLVMAVPLIWQQMPDRIGLLALARQALGAPTDEQAAAVLDLLALAERTWPVELEHGDRSEMLAVSWLTFRLIELADALVMAA